MAINTLCAKQTVDVVEKGDIVYGHRKLNVAGVAGTRPRVLSTSCATDRHESLLDNCVRKVFIKLKTYTWSPHAPIAGSWRPPGTGLLKESRVGVL